MSVAESGPCGKNTGIEKWRINQKLGEAFKIAISTPFVILNFLSSKKLITETYYDASNSEFSLWKWPTRRIVVGLWFCSRFKSNQQLEQFLLYFSDWLKSAISWNIKCSCLLQRSIMVGLIEVCLTYFYRGGGNCACIYSPPRKQHP